jgi:hypothetical protein
MQTEVVTVGIELILVERINANISTEASLDFAAAKNHGTPAVRKIRQRLLQRDCGDNFMSWPAG